MQARCLCSLSFRFNALRVPMLLIDSVHQLTWLIRVRCVDDSRAGKTECIGENVVTLKAREIYAQLVEKMSTKVARRDKYQDNHPFA